jgi:hypothetical protein
MSATDHSTAQVPVNHARSLAAAALTLVPALVVGVTASSWSDRLPDPLPTHWSSLTEPDGFGSYASTWRTMLAIAVVGALLGIVSAVLSWSNPLWQRATVGIAGGVGFGALGLWLATAHAAWRRADAHGAPLSWGVALPVVLGLLGCAVVLIVVGRRPRTVHTMQPTAGTSSALVLAPGERAVWAHREFVVWPLAIGIAVTVVAVVMAVVGTVVVAVVMVVAAVTACSLSWVQVTIDDRGVRVGLGPWAWTVKRIRLDDVVGASAEPIEAAAWGGWGYRVMPGRSAVVLRSGPALVLDLADGRYFAVTVDDPAPAVRLLDALRARVA